MSVISSWTQHSSRCSEGQGESADAEGGLRLESLQECWTGHVAVLLRPDRPSAATGSTTLRWALFESLTFHSHGGLQFWGMCDAFGLAFGREYLEPFYSTPKAGTSDWITHESVTHLSPTGGYAVPRPLETLKWTCFITLYTFKHSRSIAGDSYVKEGRCFFLRRCEFPMSGIGPS